METFEDLIKFEKEKHETFFLPFYKKKGWQVLQDNVGFNATWDVKLSGNWNGGAYTVDEKARKRSYGDFLVEIMQDLKTGNLGWLYKPKDYYFYAIWADEDLNGEPIKLYSVNANKLKEFMAENWENLFSGNKIKISRKGWGTTLFALVLWEDLLFTGVAKDLSKDLTANVWN